MELTPQLLDEQEFPVVLRGYDTDAVDDFLERVGSGVGALLDRLDQARRRLVELEAELASAKAAPSEDPVERQVKEVSRALVLAQEAADTALAEARAEAESVRTEARAEAESVRTEAHAEADHVRHTARREADAMIDEARRAVEERKASAEAEIDAHAALRRAEREDELNRLAAHEQRARADLQRVHEQLEMQRERLTAVAAAASALMENNDLEPVTSPPVPPPGSGSLWPEVPDGVAAAGSAATADAERTGLIDTPVEDAALFAAGTGAPAVNGTASPSGGTGSGQAAASAPPRPQDAASAGTGATPAGDATASADTGSVPTADAAADAGVVPGPDAAPDAGPAPTPAAVPDAGTPPGVDTPGEAAQAIPPSPPPRVAPPGHAGDDTAASDADRAVTGPPAAVPGPALSLADASPATGGSGPAGEGTTFYRPEPGDRGLFDQDEAHPVASPPRLRSVAPPDDDPFLAALRGDDQAAALLNEQPSQGDENPTGLMRLLRRR